MSTEKLVQNSFVNGQCDREVQSKERTDFVGSSIAKGLNVVSSEKGELRKRLGTRYLKTLNEETVLVPYRKGDSDLILAFSPNKLDVLSYSDDGLSSVDSYVGSTDTQFIQTWTSNTTNGYTVSASRAAQSAYTTFNIPRKDENVSPYEVSGWEYNGDNVVYNLQDSMDFFITLPSDGIIGRVSMLFGCKCSYGNAPGQPYVGYANAILKYSDDGQNWTACSTVIESPIGNSPQYNLTPGIIIMGHGFQTASIYYDIVLQEDVGEHQYWKITFIDKLDHNSKQSLPKLNIQFYLRTQSSAAQTISTDITDITAIKYSQNDTLLKVVDGEHKPKNISVVSSVSYADFTPANTITIWQNYGYPKSVVYFQNRLFFGGFDTNPNVVLGSKFNDESTFSTNNNPVQYDDYLNLKSNELKSKIDNMVGGQNVLYCFSEDGISCIDGGSTGLLATNQSIEFHLRNHMPAGSATPAFKDDIMLYSSSDGTKLYAVDYDLLVQRFQVSDIAKYAKDITTAKITRLQYVNNESKLIYGLMANNQMFALNYEKGTFQGFFPFAIQDGYIYDILAIKSGRNYKLLMVVNRGGAWYLEELEDKGQYIDTNAPFMTKEDKKWATYDNINNNIALDCYQKYEDIMDLDATLDSNNSMLLTTADLSTYIGYEVMLGIKNDELQFATVELGSVAIVNKNMYRMRTQNAPYEYAYISADTQLDNDNVPVYDANGKFVTYGYYNQSGVLIMMSGGLATMYLNNGTVAMDVEVGYLVEIGSMRGNSTYYNILYKPTLRLPVVGLKGTKCGVVSKGQYLGEYEIGGIGASYSLYGWKNGADVVYTKTPTPIVGTDLYDDEGNAITSYYQNTVAALGTNQIIINESIQQSTSQALYCWGSVYTLSATPSVGDQLYNSDGTPTNTYVYNTVYTVSGNTITTISAETPYPATYGWRPNTSHGYIIHTLMDNPVPNTTIQDTNSNNYLVKNDGYSAKSVTYNGTTYYRDASKDGSYPIIVAGMTLHFNCMGFTSGANTVYVLDSLEHDITAGESPLYKLVGGYLQDQNYNVSYANSRVQYNSGIVYLKSENLSEFYYRNTDEDTPAGTTITTASFTRDSTGDIPSQTISTIVTKTFTRDTLYDLNQGETVIILDEPVFKACYGILYDAYAFIKITRPYESMLTARQINLEVQNTMHLSIGTGLNDMQVLEDINDNTHYDLTNMTMNGSYVVVPSDTPEWEKYIILKSDKGLPFTVNAVEVIMNYSNEGGN